jgi:Tol biopolymer transport system component
LAFSPDGDYVYFTRFETRLGSNVYRIPILGGTPQPVITDVDGPVSFSPDGSRVAFLRGDTRRNDVAVIIARADGSGQQRLATRPMLSGYPLFTRAAWSPDGRTIAVAVGAQTWIGGGVTGGSALIGVDVASGRERTIVAGRWDAIANLTWLADGSLVVSGTELGHPNHQLWLVSAADGTARRVTNDLNTYPDVSAAVRAPVIVTVLGDLSSTIAVGAPGDSGGLKPITSGAGRYDGQTGVAWTPDGRLVFTSAAAGQTDLWIMDGDGRNGRQLTADAATERMVDVTADGGSAVFVADRGGQPGIWRLTFADGNVSRLTDNIHDLYPFGRADSRSILFTRFEPSPHLYELTFGGQPVRIPSVNDLAVAASPDGRTVATMSVGKSPGAIGVADLDGRGEISRFDILNAPVMVTWTPTSDALTFLESRKGTPSLWNQPLVGGEPRRILTLANERIFSFAWSRDGRLAVAHGPVPTDVVLITGTK